MLKAKVNHHELLPVATGSTSVKVGFMALLESIVEELRTLTPERLEEAALYVHRLQQSSQEERREMFRQTAGSITQEEADELKKAIEDCERIDESGW